MDVFHLLTLFGSLSLFLFGMNLMGQALERRAGSRLRMLQGESSVIRAVPELIRGIIYNLCDNAIKYNHPGGHVIVTVSKAALIIQDNGIGIPKEHLERIFERFYRVDKSHSKEVGGTGLGLSIVKHAALIHNADVTVDSTPDEGTTVTVTFPKGE